MRDSKRSIISVVASRPARALTCAALAVAFAATPVLSPVSAYAVSAETQSQLSSATEQVEASAKAYDDAVAKLNELQAKIDENTANIADIEAQLPEAQQRASEALKELYKFQKGSNPLAGLVLNSESLSDFITTCVYMNQIQSSSNEAIENLNTMQQDLEQQKVELDQAKAQLEQEKQNAADALAQAQELRSQAQAKAEAEAAAELAALAEDTAPAEGEGVSGGNPNSTATTTGETANVTVGAGGVDWNISRDDFVATWGPRIDAYLAGSPLAGYGNTFASAAWQYGVDPRWSPAIACIESTKGAHCANSFNAWGMSASGGGWRAFGSWEEAINEHVSYLQRVYGSTLTPAAAQKYCPPTWQDWYNKVASQMNLI
ncbi:hypothetical protein [Collinsella sp. An2]|uniref:coiled-coil domain-containing protein n=1 Tax=Collinsella sp. An2 TaxID=1965585 RepID=UPI001EF5B480|nr:hypothetical protein [Collinsella sp. An2]